MELYNLVYDHILIDNSSRKRNRDNDNDNDDGSSQSGRRNDNNNNNNNNNIMKLSNKVVVCKVIRSSKNKYQCEQDR